MCNIKNYRPISILSVFFAKTLEKLMHNKLKSFVSKDSIFTRPCLVSSRRVQLRQQHTLLECIPDDADRAINSAGIIFLLNDNISGYQSQNLTELIAYGMRGITYLLFKSYLLCWKQFVEIMQIDSRHSVQKKIYFFLYRNEYSVLGPHSFYDMYVIYHQIYRGQRWFYLHIVQTCCLPKKKINK